MPQYALENRSSLVSRNVFVQGRRTSIRLEPELWESLFTIARNEGKTIHELCDVVAENAPQSCFTSAVRVFIVGYLRAMTDKEPKNQFFSANANKAEKPKGFR